MTHAPPDSRPPRPFAEYRWTDRKARAFLDALAGRGEVGAAAHAMGMTLVSPQADTAPPQGDAAGAAR